jgi:hypothetical protein
MNRMFVKLSGLAVAVAVGMAVFAASAPATTVTYLNNDAFSVPNNSGIGGIATTIAVPDGLPTVQSLEVPNFRPVWTSNGSDFEAWLDNPKADRVFLMLVGCPAMPNTTNFTITDSAQFQVSTFDFCTTQLQGGQGRNEDPDSKKLSFFSGKQSSGPWTLRVRDTGVLGGGGNFNGWGLRITFAPLALNASAAKQKLGKTLVFTAGCNANCSLQIAGNAKPQTVKLTQGNPQLVPVSLSKKIRKKLAKKKAAKLTLTAADDIGDSVTQQLKILLKRKKAKK